MQSSGVGNCINTLSLARVCAFPLLMIVTMRGEWGEANPWQIPMGQIAADTLRLAGAIVYEVTEPEAAAPAVEAAARIAPTPPHRQAPTAFPRNVMLGVFTAVLDRGRDSIQGLLGEVRRRLP